MKKGLLLAAVFAASMSVTNVFAANNVESSSIETVTNVEAAVLYKGTASISMMNGRPMTGDYAASFYIDAATGEIEGEFNVAGAHDFYIIGTYSGNNGSGTGTISLPGSTLLPFTASFTQVSVGSTATFVCTATLQSGAKSVFTFTGKK